MKELFNLGGEGFKSLHETDGKGWPRGGTFDAIGIDIDWQNQALGFGDNEKEPTGALVVQVIMAAIKRLQFYQFTKFQCAEHKHAIVALKQAIQWLNSRTKKREEGRLDKECSSPVQLPLPF